MLVSSWSTNDHRPENFAQLSATRVIILGAEKFISRKVFLVRRVDKDGKSFAICLNGGRGKVEMMSLKTVKMLQMLHFYSSNRIAILQLSKLPSSSHCKVSSIKACNEMFFLYDFYERQEIYGRRMVANMARAVRTHTHTHIGWEERYFHHLIMHTKKFAIENSERAWPKQQGKDSWCLNTHFEPLTKLRTWRECYRCGTASFKNGGISRVDRRSFCQYLMHIENGTFGITRTMSMASPEKAPFNKLQLAAGAWWIIMLPNDWKISSPFNDIRCLIKMIKSLMRCASVALGEAN